MPGPVMGFLSSIQRYPDQELVVFKKLTPILIKYESVCLERIKYFYAVAVIALFQFDYFFKKWQTA